MASNDDSELREVLIETVGMARAELAHVVSVHEVAIVELMERVPDEEAALPGRVARRKTLWLGPSWMEGMVARNQIPAVAAPTGYRGGDELERVPGPLRSKAREVVASWGATDYDMQVWRDRVAVVTWPDEATGALVSVEQSCIFEWLRVRTPKRVIKWIAASLLVSAAFGMLGFLSVHGVPALPELNVPQAAFWALCFMGLLGYAMFDRKYKVTAHPPREVDADAVAVSPAAPGPALRMRVAPGGAAEELHEADATPREDAPAVTATPD